MLARFLLPLLLVASPFARTLAQSNMSDMKGFRAEFIGMFDQESKKVVQLLDAIPDEKFSWRPAEGVRSVSEVYVHIAGANKMFPAIIKGEEVDFDALMSMEKKVTTKADARDMLVKSISGVKEMVSSMSDADLEKSVTIQFIPLTTTARGVLLMLYGHLGEHLGQSIAYARMNGITPPWTAAEQQQQQGNSGY